MTIQYEISGLDFGSLLSDQNAYNKSKKSLRSMLAEASTMKRKRMFFEFYDRATKLLQMSCVIGNFLLLAVQIHN